ncbi:MAG: hypothetical protein M3N37_04495 [Actinomycetota bacterium]|nr:hypothetical protein [Actinomycetota bacterium]
MGTVPVEEGVSRDAGDIASALALEHPQLEVDEQVGHVEGGVANGQGVQVEKPGVVSVDHQDLFVVQVTMHEGEGGWRGPTGELGP